MTNCKWKKDYVDGHRGEYWYICETCGVEEWFAHYALPKDGEPGGRCKEKESK